MDPPENPAAGQPLTPRRELQLQGPRPAPLRVGKDSHKIKKPPLAPPPSRSHPAAAAAHNRQPVIIYSVSPKVIHAEESNFMSIVQRLTGPSSVDGDVSPAARFASIEKTSPSERERSGGAGGGGGGEEDDVMDLMMRGVEMGGAPGILSPAPASLQPIPAAMFSPAAEQNSLSFMHEMSVMSPYWNGLMQSPSSSSFLFSPAFVSSPTTSLDLFSLLDF